jgi:uncharacterized protein (DUF2225 family)
LTGKVKGNVKYFQQNIISKSGTRIVQRMRCDSCACLERVLWHYAKSDKGAVTLCGRCKIGAFERSFEKVDAMKMTTQRGSLKKNRSRQ